MINNHMSFAMTIVWAEPLIFIDLTFQTQSNLILSLLKVWFGGR